MKPNKLLHYSSGQHGKFLTVLGLTFAHNPWGNCFSPAVCLATSLNRKAPAAKAVLTLRTAGCIETTIYWRGGLQFDWNSGHLARRFGTFTDTDFGGITQWRGHIDL